MPKDKIIRLTLEIPESVVKEAQKRADKNRRSRNLQIVHDVEMANNSNAFVIKSRFATIS